MLYIFHLGWTWKPWTQTPVLHGWAFRTSWGWCKTPRRRVSTSSSELGVRDIWGCFRAFQLTMSSSTFNDFFLTSFTSFWITVDFQAFRFDFLDDFKFVLDQIFVVSLGHLCQVAEFLAKHRSVEEVSGTLSWICGVTHMVGIQYNEHLLLTDYQYSKIF